MNNKFYIKLGVTGYFVGVDVIRRVLLTSTLEHYFKMLKFSIFNALNTSFHKKLLLPPSHNISKKNSFSLSQNISKKDKLLSYLILFF